jgi:Na+-driven multidrug efflux pump
MLKAGVPLSVTQLGMAVGTVLFNERIMQTGGSMYLDVYGAITQLSVVAMALYEGIAQACQPILAACFGAGNRGRVHRTIRYGFVMEIIAMVLAAAMYLFGAELVADLFSMEEAALRSVAVNAIRIYALSLLFTGLNTMIIYYFQAQEKEIRATGITLLSGTILPAVFLYILTALFDVSAVWWCYLIAQGLTLILSAVLYSRDKHAAAGTAA